jgi:splicing suppressor protein 51
MFPLWWSEEKAVECEALGMNGGWSFLANVIEKSDLIEYYGISSMPMQLRMFAEQVYGRGPGGQSGTATRHVQMMVEKGQVHSNQLDMTTMFGHV